MARLTILAASTRPGRVGPQVTNWFAGIARHHGGFDVDVVDLAALNLPFHNEPNQPSDGGPYLYEHTKNWSRIVDASDAFVFVMPEYNRGYSAPLKNALDYLYVEWRHKPVGFVSYGMTSGGLRAAEMIKPVVTALKMIPVPEAVVVHLRKALDASGTLVAASGMISAATEMLDELRHLTGLLAHAEPH